MAPGLANARPPGSAKFANAPPPGLTRRANAPQLPGGELGAGGIDWCISAAQACYRRQKKLSFVNFVYLLRFMDKRRVKSNAKNSKTKLLIVMGAYTSFRSFPLFAAGRSRTWNAVTEDRGPSRLKEEEILEKTPFPLLPSYLHHIRGASNRTKKSYITSLHVDGPVTRVGGGLGLIIGSLRKKETLLLFPPVYSLKVKVAYENRKLTEKLKGKENSSGRTAKWFYSLLSWLQAKIFFLHEFISMFLIVRCILRSLFHLEVLLQEQTLAFLMFGVSMAGRISLLGWILQINIVEMF